MTTAEIHTKLQEGFEDIESGRGQDAEATFAALNLTSKCSIEQF
jgi:hypothetical protein